MGEYPPIARATNYCFTRQLVCRVAFQLPESMPTRVVASNEQ